MIVMHPLTFTVCLSRIIVRLISYVVCVSISHDIDIIVASILSVHRPHADTQLLVSGHSLITSVTVPLFQNFVHC